MQPWWAWNQHQKFWNQPQTYNIFMTTYFCHKLTFKKYFSKENITLHFQNINLHFISKLQYLVAFSGRRKCYHTGLRNKVHARTFIITSEYFVSFYQFSFLWTLHTSVCSTMGEKTSTSELKKKKKSLDYRMRPRGVTTERLAGSKYHIEKRWGKSVSDLKQLFLNQGKQTK